MIENYVDISTIINFGKGSVGVSAGKIASKENQNNSVYVGFENLEDKKEIGEKCEIRKGKLPHVALCFDNIKSIDVVIQQLKEARNLLKSMERHIMSVPIDNILIPPSFATTKPSPDKIMECFGNYVKTGKWDREIVVDRNLQLQDGYVMYLVAKYLNLKNIPVNAKDGICIQLYHGFEPIIFSDNKVYFNVEKIGDTEYVSEIRCNDSTNKIATKDFNEIVNCFMKIASVFNAEFVYLNDTKINTDIKDKIMCCRSVG